MILPRRQHQAERIAQGINQHVNFGGQSSARSADGLRAVFSRTGAVLWRAHGGVDHHVFIVVIAGQREDALETPLFAHRLKR